VVRENVSGTKALMSVLDGRQQETLSRMCVKLREGDAVKFLKELMILHHYELFFLAPRLFDTYKIRNRIIRK
jgi:hypothetical protein